MNGGNLYRYRNIRVVSQKGKPDVYGENLKTDPGGKAYKDSDCALKINARAAAKNMPLLREFDNYVDWETDAKRWVGMLYNHPVSFGIDYFVNNSKGRKTSKIDVEEVGFLNHKARSKIKKMGKKF